MSLTADNPVADRQGSTSAARRDGSAARLDSESISPTDWDEVAAGFDGVVQEQLNAYAAVRWPSTTREAHIFRLGGEVVGGALIMVQRLPLRLGAVGICKWGPILKDASRPDAAEIYAGMIETLIAEYAERRRMLLSVLPRAATTTGNAQFEHLMARGFRRGIDLRYPARYIVRIDIPEAEQRRSLGQKWRYHLNKAEKADLAFERAGAERLAEFDALYAAMGDRKNFPDYSAYNTIAALFDAGAHALRPELFFVRHQGTVVAGAIIFKAGDTAVYLFGATNDAALPLRAGYFMHWRIIEWLRETTGARWYDLGGTDGFMGLYQFKKGMVGTAGVIADIPPVANYAAYPVPMLLGTTAFTVREAVQTLRWHLGIRFGSKARPDQPPPDSPPAE
jgi:lipid II:glycine glycyltransferase (peptidoglycan interpeptide bridge formation enzyme)